MDAKYGEIKNILKQKDNLAINYTYINDIYSSLKVLEGNSPSEVLTNNGEVTLFNKPFTVKEIIKSEIYDTKSYQLLSVLNTEIFYISFDMDKDNQTYNLYTNFKTKLYENTVDTNDFIEPVGGLISRITFDELEGDILESATNYFHAIKSPSVEIKKGTSNSGVVFDELINDYVEFTSPPLQDFTISGFF